MAKNQIKSLAIDPMSSNINRRDRAQSATPTVWTIPIAQLKQLRHDGEKPN